MVEYDAVEELAAFAGLDAEVGGILTAPPPELDRHSPRCSSGDAWHASQRVREATE